MQMTDVPSSAISRVAHRPACPCPTTTTSASYVAAISDASTGVGGVFQDDSAFVGAAASAPSPVSFAWEDVGAQPPRMPRAATPIDPAAAPLRKFLRVSFVSMLSPFLVDEVVRRHAGMQPPKESVAHGLRKGDTPRRFTVPRGECHPQEVSLRPGLPPAGML